MRILFVGDVVGAPGRQALRAGLRIARRRLTPDLVIVNGENAAGGLGLTPKTAEAIFRSGADVITGGNHTWHRPEIIPYLEDHPRVVRPENYPPPCPGRGWCLATASDGTNVGVLNLLGRVFMAANVDDPFRSADVAIAAIRKRARVVVVDFHAEATSEKGALGAHLDGRVSAVFGTHTHVATADARILAGGTAYITDVGMTGPHDSVIGVATEDALSRFRSQRPVPFTTARDDLRLSGAVVDVEPSSGLATSIERVEIRPAAGAME